MTAVYFDSNPSVCFLNNNKCFVGAGKHQHAWRQTYQKDVRASANASWDTWQTYFQKKSIGGNPILSPIHCSLV